MNDEFMAVMGFVFMSLALSSMGIANNITFFKFAGVMIMVAITLHLCGLMLKQNPSEVGG